VKSSRTQAGRKLYACTDAKCQTLAPHSVGLTPQETAERKKQAEALRIQQEYGTFRAPSLANNRQVDQSDQISRQPAIRASVSVSEQVMAVIMSKDARWSRWSGAWI